MKNIMITLEYDGTRYNGWQKQGNTENTIQGKLEAILSRYAGHPIEVHGSGRTDAGVHARYQVANFHIEDELVKTAAEMADYLNRYLPEDIRVLEAQEADLRFHSRLNAVEKTYEYNIETAKKKSVFDRKYVYGLGEVPDIALMKEAADHFIGTHDFKSFCGNKKMKKSTVRTIYSIDIRQESSRIIITYTGDGFLAHMVRILTGTLLEAGLGKKKPEEMDEILAAMDRSRAGFTAPSDGLFLIDVKY